MVGVVETSKQSHEAPPSRGVPVAAAGLVCLAWAACVWVASQLDAEPIPHKVALFAHLTSLIVGFGAVLAIDYYGLLWLLRQRSIDQVIESAVPLSMLVWVGLAGLAVTGVLLQPNLAAPLTQAKLILVLIIPLNGLNARALRRRLTRHGNTQLSPTLLGYGAVSALVSQFCWWGAVVIGFLNSQT